ncbi:MAG TPA: SDR family oxidoreductase [Mycobacteriales bacterium]|nr:SDR family oxidoreductase [Mycobacteriales bacterium]
MDLGLTGRVYVVTGGSKGLGYAAAAALVAEGANVLVASRSGDAVAAAVERLGNNAQGAVADNADPDAPDWLVAAAVERWGRLDGALISVGGPPATPALDATDEQWRDAFESVFLGAVRTARAVISRLDDGGAVGLVLSTSVKAPIPGLAISSGLRPGLAMWAKQLADEVGPRGIRVVGFLPGRVSTDRTLSLTPDAASRDRLAESIPLRRFGEPEEFGRVATFALSPAASYLTGCVIPVDGGALRAV